MSPAELAAFLKVDPQDPEVRRILIGDFINNWLTPAQKQQWKSMTAEQFLAANSASVEAFIQYRVAEVALAVVTPGTPTDANDRKYGQYARQ